MKRNYLLTILVATLITLLMVIGCGRKQTNATADLEPTLEETQPAPVLDFKPVQEDVPPPMTTPEPVITEPATPPPPQIIEGFRVQIFALTSLGAAQEEKAKAERKFVYPVYIDFIENQYKVRVGDFVSRFDAETFRNLAAESYQDAFIVPCTINN